MKKLLPMLISLLLSFNSYGGSYGGYTELGKADNGGDTFYINFDSIKERDGYVYWWFMTSNDDDSSQSYVQGDCDLTRIKLLQGVFSDKPMAQGESMVVPVEDNWNYLPPDSMAEVMLRVSCEWLGYSSKEKQTFIEELKVYVDTLSYGNDLTDEVEQADSDNINGKQAQYVRSIAEKVKSNWRYQGANDDWTAEVYILQDRHGNVLAVDVRNTNVGNSSRAKTFTDSIERAVRKSTPLPYTSNDDVFDKELVFVFSSNR